METFTPGTRYAGPSSNPTAASSGNVAAGTVTATIAAVSGKTNWIEGFTITGAGATAAGVIIGTVTGLLAGTLTFDLAVPAGVTAPIGSSGSGGKVVHRFPTPLPASDHNVAIAVSFPSFGAGNTHSCVTAFGFQVDKVT